MLSGKSSRGPVQYGLGTPISGFMMCGLKKKKEEKKKVAVNENPVT